MNFLCPLCDLTSATVCYISRAGKMDLLYEKAMVIAIMRCQVHSPGVLCHKPTFHSETVDLQTFVSLESLNLS